MKVIAIIVLGCLLAAATIAVSGAGFLLAWDSFNLRELTQLDLDYIQACGVALVLIIVAGLFGAGYGLAADD